MENIEWLDRDLHKVFHGSSPDRGLEHLLKIWPDVVKEVPDATLEIAYGFQLFDRFYSDNPSSMAWKKRMLEMMNYPGITDHGRLSQPEVTKLMKRCAVMAYPTHFGEINCITALKSQALGLEPVVIDYAALQTTVQYGKKIPGDIYDPETKVEFTKALIDTLKNPMTEEKRKEMMKWAQDTFAWKKIANQWIESFKEVKK